MPHATAGYTAVMHDVNCMQRNLLRCSCRWHRSTESVAHLTTSWVHTFSVCLTESALLDSLLELQCWQALPLKSLWDITLITILLVLSCNLQVQVSQSEWDFVMQGSAANFLWPRTADWSGWAVVDTALAVLQILDRPLEKMHMCSAASLSTEGSKKLYDCCRALQPTSFDQALQTGVWAAVDTALAMLLSSGRLQDRLTMLRAQ